MDTASFGTTASEVLEKVFTGGLLIGIFVIIASVIIGVALYLRWMRKFNISVEIKSLRGSGSSGQPIYKIINDVGGIIENKKDKTRWFRIKGQKVDLPTPPLEAFQIDSKGRNHIKILQKSDTEFYYLLPDKIDLKNVVRNGVLVPIAEAEMKVADGDVVYWGQIRKRDDKKLFDMESLIMKLLPYLIPMLMFMLVIFLTYMITDHWGEFSSAASALNEAAHALRDVSIAGTTQG